MKFRTKTRALGIAIVMATFLTAALQGCGILFEPGPAAKTVKLSADAGGGEDPFACVEKIRVKITDSSQPAKTHLNEPFVVECLKCARSVIGKAFDTVKGEGEGRLSAAEFRTLETKKIIPEIFKNKKNWEVMAGLLSFFDQAGEGAVSQATLFRFIDWLDRHKTLILEYSNRWVDGNAFDVSTDWPMVLRAQDPVIELWDLLSDHGALTRPQYDLLIDGVEESLKSTSEKFQPMATWKRNGLWNMRRLFFRTDERDAFLSSGLKDLLKVFTYMTSDIGELVKWRSNFWTKALALGPAEFEEMPRAEAHIRNYFSGSGFASLNEAEFHDVVSVYLGRNVTVDFGAKLFALLKRWSGTPDGRLHPKFVSIVLSDFTPALRQMAEAGKELGCVEAYTCFTHKGKVSASIQPILWRHVFKTGIDWSEVYEDDAGNYIWNTNAKPIFPADGRLRGHQVALSIQDEHLMRKVFTLFDTDGDGQIAYEGVDVAKVQEAYDLSATALGLVKEASVDPDKPTTAEDINKPTHSDIPLVTPQAIYKIAGFYADRLMPDGNSDGKLNASELYSVADFLRRTQDLVSMAGGTFGYIHGLSVDSTVDTTGGSGGGNYWTAMQAGKLVFSRQKVLKEFWAPAERGLSYQFREWQASGVKTREKVGEALLGPVSYVGDGMSVGLNPGTISKIDDGIRPDAFMPWAAYSVVLDRIWLRCDLNNDKILDPDEQFILGKIFVEGLQMAVDAGLVEKTFLVKFVLSKKENKKLIRSVIQLLAFKEGAITGLGDLLGVMNPLSEVKPIEVKNLYVMSSKFL